MRKFAIAFAALALAPLAACGDAASEPEHEGVVAQPAGQGDHPQDLTPVESGDDNPYTDEGDAGDATVMEVEPEVAGTEPMDTGMPTDSGFPESGDGGGEEMGTVE